MKIAIIGAGTAGLFTAVDFCYSLPPNFKVDLIYDPLIESIDVGGATLTPSLTSLGFIDYSHAEDRGLLDSTTKLGVQFKNWKGDKFIPFAAGAYGIHFNTKTIGPFILSRLHKK